MGTFLFRYFSKTDYTLTTSTSLRSFRRLAVFTTILALNVLSEPSTAGEPEQDFPQDAIYVPERHFDFLAEAKSRWPDSNLELLSVTEIGNGAAVGTFHEIGPNNISVFHSELHIVLNKAGNLAFAYGVPTAAAFTPETDAATAHQAEMLAESVQAQYPENRGLEVFWDRTGSLVALVRTASSNIGVNSEMQVVHRAPIARFANEAAELKKAYPTDLRVIAGGFNVITDAENIRATSASGQCVFRAAFDHANNGINQIEDLQFSDVSVSAPCTSSPDFPPSNNFSFSDVREAHSLFYLKKARLFAAANAWNYISGNRSSPIKPRINSASLAECPGTVPPGAIACYSPNTHELVFRRWTGTGTLNTPREFEPYILAHEFSHHFFWTWKDYGSGCSISDDRQRVEEAISDVYAYTMMVSHFGAGVTYFGNLTVFRGNWRHDDSNFNIYSPISSGCLSSVNYRPFTQAFWEILWNVNCLHASCDSTNVPASNASIAAANSVGWSSTSEAAKWIVRAIAYAIKTSSGSDTGFDFIQRVVDFFVLSEAVLPSGSVDAIISIFNHHAFGVSR